MWSVCLDKLLQSELRGCEDTNAAQLCLLVMVELNECGTRNSSSPRLLRLPGAQHRVTV